MSKFSTGTKKGISTFLLCLNALLSVVAVSMLMDDVNFGSLFTLFYFVSSAFLLWDYRSIQKKAQEEEQYKILQEQAEQLRAEQLQKRREALNDLEMAKEIAERKEMKLSPQQLNDLLTRKDTNQNQTLLK